MGHEFISPLRKAEVIAGLAQSIDAKTANFVSAGLHKLSDEVNTLHAMQYPLGIKADLIVMEVPDHDACQERIKEYWPQVSPGGYLCFVGYHHKNPGMLRAVAKEFSLMDVTIFPDSVAAVMKQ